MSTLKQKDIFLLGEGDAWFDRNYTALQSIENWESDSVVKSVKRCFERGFTDENALLEIGCGSGTRLHWLSQKLGLKCFGIDPSEKAVTAAKKLGVDAIQGTADSLEYPNESFDCVIFGFCLYLCDREDLFKIASEAHRVLKKNSWLIVNDFYAKTPTMRTYHHKEGLHSYKMDYRSAFDWHPDFTCSHHEVHHHKDVRWTDDSDEWVATSVLRKCAQ